MADEETRGFSEFDHSGDIGIEARGRDMGELFANAARGLFSLMLCCSAQPVLARRVNVASTSWEELLVDWLSEIIARSSAEGEVYADVSIERIVPYLIEADLLGEKIDPEKHELRFEVKAATYHGIEVYSDGDELRARVIFDL